MTEKMQNEISWKKYPRPQLRRGLFHILENGWHLNGQDIRVPFPPQAANSGCQGALGTKLTYEVCFMLPEEFTKERVLLHFGAVDQVAEVWLNGKCVGTHEGGYLPFSFDVTAEVLREQENRLVVKVTDELSEVYPYGKQSKTPGGMWYTPVSGIWKPVWLENVSESYLTEVKISPDLCGVRVYLTGNQSVERFTFTVELGDGDTLTERFEGDEGYLCLKGRLSDKGVLIEPKLWSPEHPQLYFARITMGEDTAETYFALRELGCGIVDGQPRLLLNGEPVFLHGVLDQGYYPDGIYLPDCEEEYERDVLRMKELGFNMLRKHCKVEPEWFYYYCDVHGMLVLQDIVNSGEYSFLRDTALPTVGFVRFAGGKKAKSSEERRRRAFFEQHMKDTIHLLYNHPCVIGYTIFNEGWGQFDADRMYEVAKATDASRWYDTTSGWFTKKKSDVESKHVYFRTKKLRSHGRPVFLSECGGFSYLIREHCYSTEKSYGYGACESKEALTERIVQMYRKMVLPAVKRGLCGCVYTQVSDIEEEINGLYTYDRQVCKVEKEAMCRLAAELSFANKFNP